MDKLKRSLALLAAVAASCASGVTTLQNAMTNCANGAPFVEIQTSGIVTQYLGMRSSVNGTHEGFIFRSGGRSFRVEDNIDITGPVPLHKGDTISLQGQYECNDGVIHYTHHDPRFRHIGGYIHVNGKTYQ